MTISRILRVLGVVAAGGSAGLLSSVLVHRSTATVPAATTPVVSIPAVKKAPIPILEQTLQLPPSGESCSAEDAETRAVKVAKQREREVTAARDRTPEGRAERRKEELDELNARVTAHMQEPRDPSWATQTERSVRSRLATPLAAKNSSLSSVDCRSVSCVAQVSWPDGDKAKTEMLALITEIGEAAPGAARFMTIDGNRNNAATVVLDWTESLDHVEEK